MVVFWIFATLMTVVALAFVLVPLLRTRAAGPLTAAESNLEVLRSQRREIDADVAAGTLPADAREEALQDLVGRAAEDLDSAPPAVASARKPWIAVAVAGLAIPVIAFGLYHAIGQPIAVDPRITGSSQAPMDDRQMEAMVENLARKVREKPDNAEGWALLARSMSALERFREASDAYEHLMKLAPGDPQVMADYADALGMAQGRTLQGRPYELAKEALKIDPKHKKALALAGTAALDAGDFNASIGYWERLEKELPTGSPDATQVQSVLAEVRGRAGNAGSAARVPVAPKAPPVMAAAGAKNITGSVALSPAMAGKVTGDETLYIFARAEGGPRVPLAVVRSTAAKLPMQFALDDSQAMSPGMNISSAQAVRIEARISRSGNALPQPGDLIGTSAVVKPGARDVAIVVDKAVP